MRQNTPPSGDPEAHRSAVQRRLASLESEVAQLRQELAALGREQLLPGLFLTVEVAGALALLPTEAVQEVVRLVELSPLPSAPAHVVGTFLYRGAPAVVVDLSVLLGVQPRARAGLPPGGVRRRAPRGAAGGPRARHRGAARCWWRALPRARARRGIAPD